jgi:hypothetical protein
MKSSPGKTKLVTGWVMVTGWLVAMALFNALRGVTIAGVAFPISLLPIAVIITVTVMLRRNSPGARIAASVVPGWMVLNGLAFVIRSYVLGHFSPNPKVVIFILVVLGLNSFCLLYLWGNQDGNPLSPDPAPPTVDQYFE